MYILSNRTFRIGLLLVGVTALVYDAYLQQIPNLREASLLAKYKSVAKVIPKGGLAENDTHGTVPGDINHTLADMKRLHACIQIYRRRHNGQFPDNQAGRGLLADVMQNHQEYGFASMSDLGRWLYNPDMKYADGVKGTAHPETQFPYKSAGVRPDGTPAGSPKPGNSRDVLAYTDMYFHRNIRLFKGDKTTTNPVGFYLVLWDDGEVQQVPYQEVQFLTQQGNAHFPEVFAGQAGVPTGNALSYDEYQKWREKNH